ncbi:MAG: hypothetical protein JJT81_11640 [Rubellimicrobium sp.]|nr:hypothetical protein [Rubellimicrobium sp.]
MTHFQRLRRAFALILLLATGALLPLPAAAAEACGAFPVGAESHTCDCATGAAGAVWGSGPYTSDSNICTAARHAGAIGAEGGSVTAVAAPGAASYAGSIRNGVETRNWGSYPSSFDIVLTTAGVEACGRYPDAEAALTCHCAPGAATGSVWGSGPYTSDSNICAAAVHAALIGEAGGVVTALRVIGLESYTGSEVNGIATRNWGSYPTSFTFNTN